MARNDPFWAHDSNCLQGLVFIHRVVNGFPADRYHQHVGSVDTFPGISLQQRIAEIDDSLVMQSNLKADRSPTNPQGRAGLFLRTARS